MVIKTNPQDFSKYERARILGARALQISMDAPLLINVEEEELEGMNYNPLRIAEKELDSGVLPISVKRPMPQKKHTPLEKLRIEKEKEEEKKKEEKEREEQALDEKAKRREENEEKEIAKEGEIMEIVEEDEDDFSETESGGEASGEME